MSQATLPEELGLIRDAGFLRDPLWWAFVVAGLIAAACLWLLLPNDIPSTVPFGPMEWLSLLLWQPALEELAFRGLLQGQLLKVAWAKWRLLQFSGANVITSVGFTALHFLYHPPLWALGVFVPSLVFGWLRERHGTVWSPMAMHVLFNTAFFVTAWLAAH